MLYWACIVGSYRFKVASFEISTPTPKTRASSRKCENLFVVVVSHRIRNVKSSSLSPKTQAFLAKAFMLGVVFVASSLSSPHTRACMPANPLAFALALALAQHPRFHLSLASHPPHHVRSFVGLFVHVRRFRRVREVSKNSSMRFDAIR